MLILNKDNFKSEVLENKAPVLVEFYSVGCGPCRLLEPILRGIADKISSDQGIKFAKLDSHDGMDVFTENRVSHVPTMILFKDGKAIDRKLGLMSERDIVNWITSALKEQDVKERDEGFSKLKKMQG